MKHKQSKLLILSALMTTAFLITGCGGEEEPNELELQYQKNVSEAPERTEDVLNMIEESRGTEVTDVEGKGTGEFLGSSTKGQKEEVRLAVLNKEQLQSLDKMEQIGIYLNGILRDEYHVAANTLYGKEYVSAEKERIKEALLSEDSDGYGTLVDIIGERTELGYSHVAKEHVDEVIKHFNRVYLNPVIDEDFNNRVVVGAITYPLTLPESLASVKEKANEFVDVPTTKMNELSDEDFNELGNYYKESLVSALEISGYRDESYYRTLGGFEIDEDGLWKPVNLNKLLERVIQITYLDK